MVERDFKSIPGAFTAPFTAVQDTLQALGHEALGRMTLLANHVIAQEPAAMQRLALQAGKTVQVQWRGWPSFVPAVWAARLPLPAPARWSISPAGLLDLEARLPAAAGAAMAPGAGPMTTAEAEPAAEGVAPSEPASLTVTLDPGDLGRWLLAPAGGRPPMDIEGDAALAAEVAWLAEHLRWDVEDDLARIVGDLPAHQIAKVMRWFVEGSRRLAAGGLGLARSTAEGISSLRRSRGDER